MATFNQYCNVTQEQLLLCKDKVLTIFSVCPLCDEHYKQKVSVGMHKTDGNYCCVFHIFYLVCFLFLLFTPFFLFYLFTIIFFFICCIDCAVFHFVHMFCIADVSIAIKRKYEYEIGYISSNEIDLITQFRDASKLRTTLFIEKCVRVFTEWHQCSEKQCAVNLDVKQQSIASIFSHLETCEDFRSFFGKFILK